MNRRAGSCGFSLMEVIVGVGLTGAAVVTGAALLAKYITSVEYATALGYHSDLQKYVTNSIDCAKTFADPVVVSACQKKEGSPLKVLDVSGAVLIDRAADPTTLYGSQMRARCRDEGGFFGVYVEYLPISKNGGVKKASLTGITPEWKDLFNGVPHACAVGVGDCDIVSDFSAGPDANFEASWRGNVGNPPCSKFAYGAGVATVGCGDNSNANLWAKAPGCISKIKNISMHIEADVYTSNWADGYPVAGIWVGDIVANKSLWFTVLSDSIAGSQDPNVVLKPVIAKSSNALARSTVPSKANTKYHLVVDVTPTTQAFSWSIGGVQIGQLNSALSFDLTGMPVNFACMEAKCSFSNLKVKISPL